MKCAFQNEKVMLSIYYIQQNVRTNALLNTTYSIINEDTKYSKTFFYCNSFFHDPVLRNYRIYS